VPSQRPWCAMPLRACPIFLFWALACGTNWASAVAREAPPGCFAGDDGASCQLEEPHGAAEAEDQDGMSQLQIAGGRSWHPQRKSCAKLAPEITKSCNVSNLWNCFGYLDNEGSVETTLPDTCAKSGEIGEGGQGGKGGKGGKGGEGGEGGVAPHRPGVRVYKIYNDSPTKQALTSVCGLLPYVDFDYATSCFGEINGKCQDTACSTCKGGEATPPGVTCDLEPGETKYVALWFKRKPRCSKLAPDVTKKCDISDLMTCIGTIDFTDPVETELDRKCAEKAGIQSPRAKVYEVHNDLWREQTLTGEDFCSGLPVVDFKYAISCFGNDAKGSCENQGCTTCEEGAAEPGCECKCVFKPGETKYIAVWSSQPDLM